MGRVTDCPSDKKKHIFGFLSQIRCYVSTMLCWFTENSRTNFYINVCWCVLQMNEIWNLIPNFNSHFSQAKLTFQNFPPPLPFCIKFAKYRNVMSPSFALIFIFVTDRNIRAPLTPNMKFCSPFAKARNIVLKTRACLNWYLVYQWRLSMKSLDCLMI